MKRNFGPTLLSRDIGKFKVAEVTNGIENVIVKDCPFADLSPEDICNKVCPLKDNSNGKCTMIKPTSNYLNLKG